MGKMWSRTPTQVRTSTMAADISEAKGKYYRSVISIIFFTSRCEFNWMSKSRHLSFLKAKSKHAFKVNLTQDIIKFSRIYNNGIFKIIFKEKGLNKPLLKPSKTAHGL